MRNKINSERYTFHLIFPDPTVPCIAHDVPQFAKLFYPLFKKLFVFKFLFLCRSCMICWNFEILGKFYSKLRAFFHSFELLKEVPIFFYTFFTLKMSK